MDGPSSSSFATDETKLQNISPDYGMNQT